jgi:predicted DNA-binding transcriptional regulator AlpA
MKPDRVLLRWLLRELSTDAEDMIALVDDMPESDDDDAQALLEELVSVRPEKTLGPIQVEYRDGKQLLGPADAAQMLNLTRATFYAVVKRETFPRPVSIDDDWLGWPRDLILEWADRSASDRLATSDHAGYAPFERSLGIRTAASGTVAPRKGNSG